MPIENENPIVIPPTDQPKVFDKLWITMQSANAPTFDACRLSVTFRPYTVTNGLSEFAPMAPNTLIRFNDQNLFDLHVRKPYVAEAIKGALQAMGVTVPDGVPAQLMIMEVLAQCWGAAAQAKPPVDEYGSDEYGSDENSSNA